MGYNLLNDTSFKENNWKFVNCEIKNGILESTSKVFGIKQELVLPDITKLYFRINYQVLNQEIYNVKIGILNNDILHITEKTPKVNKKQLISVVEQTKQEKIIVYVTFESSIDNNEVKLKEPLLVDLISQNKSSYLKPILDKILKYQYGYSYKNLYKESEITIDNEDFNNKEKAKIGIIASIIDKEEFRISCEFIPNRYYLVKLDFKEVNRFGDMFFKYGARQSTRVGEQLWLLFKATENKQLQLILKNNEVYDYKVNLKHLLIIDITDMGLLTKDIEYLPFL